MTSTTFFIIFIPILAILLLAINLILAPHNPYQEKDSVFECGFHSFLGQNRTQFSVSFFIFGLLFLLFDLEILLVYPYSVSSYTNDIYGLVIMMVFFVLLTLGFIFELGKNALTIESRQTSFNNGDVSTPHAFWSNELPNLTGVLLKSSLIETVDLLQHIVVNIESGGEVYDAILDRNAADISSEIDKWAAEKINEIEEAAQNVASSSTPNDTQEDLDKAANSTEALVKSGKEEVEEARQVAHSLYESDQPESDQPE